MSRAAVSEPGREFVFDEEHFRLIAELLRRLTGIQLAPRKAGMVYARLVRRLRVLGLDDFDAYCARLESDADGSELDALVNALTTNLTAFFREPHHFRHLADVVVPAARVAGTGQARPRLRVWSAGCSSGEEAYSIAMTLHAAMSDLGGWDARVLATDIDTAMIAAAVEGLYAPAAVAAVPAGWRERFLMPANADGMQRFAVAGSVRRLVTFKALNLIEDWPMRGPFDAIFCRNVLIYFDRPNRSGTVERFADLLAPGGYLYLGHSESLFGLSNRFEQVAPTTYRRRS